MNSQLLKSLAAGFGVGVVLMGSLYAVLITQRVRAGRVALKAVVVNRDIAEGEVLKQQDLGQISLPKTYRSSSLVSMEDFPAVVGQPVTQAMLRGDLLSWTAFARRERLKRIQACVDAVTPEVRQARLKQGHQALEAFTQQAAPPQDPPPAIPDFPFDEKNETPVVVVTRKLSAGELLTEESLELRWLPRPLVTASLVPESSLQVLTGARVVAAMEAGEPLRWQFLDHPERPRSMGSCLGQVYQAAQKEAERVVPEQVRAYLDKTPEGH